MTRSPDRLNELLPAIYRQRDAEQGWPLQALLQVITEQVDIVEADIDQLYENSYEAALLLLSNQELRIRTSEVLDLLIPKAQLIMKGEQSIIGEVELAEIKILLNAFAGEASPKLRNLIWKVTKDLKKGEFLQQLGFILED